MRTLKVLVVLYDHEIEHSKPDILVVDKTTNNTGPYMSSDLPKTRFVTKKGPKKKTEKLAQEIKHLWSMTKGM